MWYDFNGDARVNVLDLSEVRGRIGTYLPFTQPATASIAATAPLRPRPVARGLFGSEPILA